MGRTKIAIFEDDTVNRFLYGQILQKNSAIECKIFSNIQDGLETFRHETFHIIFIEVHFWKDFGGLDILAALKPFTQPSTVFVAMTSLLQEGDVAKLMNAGFSICVEKPIVFHEQFFVSTARGKDGSGS